MSKSYVIIEQPDKMAIYVVVLTKEGTATFWDDVSDGFAACGSKSGRGYSTPDTGRIWAKPAFITTGERRWCGYNSDL